MPQQLEDIANALRRGIPVAPVTVRAFLGWFNAQRRGYWVVEKVNSELSRLGIITAPDYETTWLDNQIKFVTTAQSDLEAEESLSSDHNGADRNTDSGASDCQEDSSGSDNDDQRAWVRRDPTYRISKLEAANRKVVSVSPDATFSEVTSIMMLRGFSQIPVVSGTRDVRGVVSWASIGRRVVARGSMQYSRDVMERPHIIGHEQSIFDAIPMIVTNDYVIVKG